MLCFGASALLLMKSKQQHSSSGCMPLSAFITVVTVKMISLLFVLLSRLLLLVLVFYCPVLLLVIVLPFGSSAVSSCSAVVSRFSAAPLTLSSADTAPIPMPTEIMQRLARLEARVSNNGVNDGSGVIVSIVFLFMHDALYHTDTFSIDHSSRDTTW